MVDWVHIAFPILLCVILVITFIILWRPIGKKTGREVQWNLDSNRATEIISNKRLGALQQLDERGGILKPHDLVVVWAQEFLDDDILYETVKRNIQGGIRYLYILDVHYTNRVLTLLRKLIDDIGDRGLINEMIDVIFVKPSLTLNNFVLMSAESGNDVLYAGLIYDERPFGWVRQHQARAASFLRKVKRIVAALGIVQLRQNAAEQDLHRLTSDYGISAEELLLITPADQIMDFSGVGQSLLNNRVTGLDTLPIRLRDFVAITTLPEDVDARIVRLADHLGQRGKDNRMASG